MGLCLHCSKPCADDVLFCEACQDHAGGVFHWEIPDYGDLRGESSSISASTVPAPDEMEREWPGSIAMPFKPAESSSDGGSSRLSALVQGGPDGTTDLAISKLSAAARQIAEEGSGRRRSLRSRSARLRPLRDISSEIQRGSTPHPRIKRLSEFATRSEMRVARDDKQAVKRTPPGRSLDSWTWSDISGDEYEGEPENDLWANSADPLIARARPTIAEAAHIEEEDIRRVAVEEHVTLPYKSTRRPRRGPLSWRLAFSLLVVLALAALTIDGLLLLSAFNRASSSQTGYGGPPTLLLSTTVAYSNESVSLALAHFAPMTSVVLTHDIQEMLFTTSHSSALRVAANGQATASFTVSSSWGPGFHLIVAEDVATRDTASAMLQVNGTGPSRPPHLLLDSSTLDLGSSVQGADTIQPFVLRNSGDGAISWSASSDQPWLLVAPQQGTFNVGQIISIASQRNNLPPGRYTGTITLFSNVGAPEQLQVSMVVNALPPNAGPMISLSPPLLSFTTLDGSSTPETQVVTLSNPGQQVLHWSLTGGKTIASTLLPENQKNGSPGYSLPNSWLSPSMTSGTLAPGQIVQLRMTVRSQALLPGTYMESLAFSSSWGPLAYDTPQMINVALTVQPHCGLVTSTGNLNFTAVSGQSNPGNDALSLSATSSCATETLNWKATPSAGWIVVDPTSGQLKGTNGTVLSIGVNIAGLAPHRYSGMVTFQAGKSTQTVSIMLNLQPRPAPSAPIMSISSLSLNFSSIQGQANPAGQVIAITNNGGSLLKWHTSVVSLGTSWISFAPGGGTILPDQTGQVMVNVNTGQLAPGNYTALLTLIATDARGAPASGSPQTITVSLIVQPPCTLAPPSSSTLLFTGSAGGANPAAQMVSLTSTGSCSWPLHWSTSISPAASWLTLSPASGLIGAASQQGTITVGVNLGGLAPGNYTTQVTVSAVDSAGMQARNSPQTFSIALTVLQRCTLQQLPAQIVLSASQGQATVPSQTFTLSETGSCNNGVAWTAVGNSASSTWLSLSSTSGTDNGSGSTITVTASPALSPGSYTGQITVSASNNGVVLQNSPQTITVTFQITGYTVSGTVVTCGDSNCTSSQSLGGATLTLVDGGNNVIATTTADSSGNFTFSNVPLGTYTINASGTSGATNYSGTASGITVGGNTSVSVRTFSSP